MCIKHIESCWEFCTKKSIPLWLQLTYLIECSLENSELDNSHLAVLFWNPLTPKYLVTVRQSAPGVDRSRCCNSRLRRPLQNFNQCSYSVRMKQSPWERSPQATMSGRKEKSSFLVGTENSINLQFHPREQYWGRSFLSARQLSLSPFLFVFIHSEIAVIFQHELLLLLACHSQSPTAFNFPLILVSMLSTSGQMYTWS